VVVVVAAASVPAFSPWVLWQSQFLKKTRHHLNQTHHAQKLSSPLTIF
jgi:hypothetical protein